MTTPTDKNADKNRSRSDEAKADDREGGLGTRRDEAPGQNKSTGADPNGPYPNPDGGVAPEGEAAADGDAVPA